MPADTFICGECQLAFHDITLFIQHKKDGCSGAGITLADDGTQQLLDTGANQVYIIQEAVDGGSADVEAFFENFENQVEQNEGTYLLENAEVTDNMKTDDAAHSTVELVPVTLTEGSVPDKLDGLTSMAPIDFQIVLKQPNIPPRGGAARGRGTGKRRGRPRKSEAPVAKPPPKVVENQAPERDPDGMFRCNKCKKGFGKERHYRTHRCMSNTDYVGLVDQDLSPDELADNVDDDGTEFRPTGRPFTKRGRGRPRLSRSGTGGRSTVPSGSTTSTISSLLQEAQSLKGELQVGEVPKLQTLALKTAQSSLIVEDSSILHVLLNNADVSSSAQLDGISVENPEGSVQQGPSVLQTSVSMVTSSSEAQQLVTMAAASAEEIENSAESGRVSDMPIFTNDEDKQAFEEALAVDYSDLVANLYKVHMIEQNVNDHALHSYNRASNELTVFSCDVCDKVFMSLSQIRVHCLTHTQYKPFKCFKCNYSTNCRGNLYTHMRKHTGQLFSCSQCDFKSANRTHVLEHEDTHLPGKRHKCRICRRNYKTGKSLVNHVRKYHSHTKNGEIYLNELQGKHKKGPALIHQCHVCNRKFKKKIDRDRHLVVHNIQNADTYVCKLCNHVSTRRDFLARHVLGRHRVVYRCSLCLEEFPSCVRLMSHLNDTHAQEQVPSALFESCINHSYFLPEPDGRTDSWGTENTSNESDSVSETQVSVLEESLSQQSTDTPGTSSHMDDQVKSVLDKAELLPLLSGSLTESTTFTSLGYKEMTMDVFKKLRDTFGNEECEQCGRLFFYKTDFESHSKTHSKEKPFQCSQCDFRASSQEIVRRHTLRVHEKAKYICNLCDEYFLTLSEFSAHSNTAHGDQTSSGNTKQIQCCLCDISFESQFVCTSVKRLKIHLHVKHSELGAEEVRKCLSPYQRPSSRIGRKLYKCPYCDKTYFRGASDLQCHLWIHQGIKPFKCPVDNCSYACRSKSNLSTHLLRHSSRKPFNCSICNKAYKSRTALRWHVRSHKDGKLFKCTKCTYAASQKSHLVRHLQTHDVVKRFRCELCSYSANTVGYMKLHYTRNHKGCQFIHVPQVPAKAVPSDTKVYSCLSCDYMFGNLSDMKRHLRTRHHLANDDMASLIKLDMSNALVANIGSETVVETADIETTNAAATADGVEVLTQGISTEGLVDEQGVEGLVEQSGIETITIQQPIGHIQVMETDDLKIESNEQHASVALQALQYSGKEDQATFSKDADVLQHYISLQQQEADVEEVHHGLIGDNVVTIANDQHPQTIIVQPNQEVVLADDGGMNEEQRYVIQYMAPDGTMATVHEITVPNAHTGVEEMLVGSGVIHQPVGVDQHHIITSNEPMETSVEESILDEKTVPVEKVEVQESPCIEDGSPLQVTVLENAS